jgi:NADPH:quinone reductase-like Zn-dependent oxidoreductase
MKAATIDRFATPAQIHEIAEPQLEDRAVLFRVTAAGVNPIDWKIRDGEAGKRSFPLILGQDFAGIVERVGNGVTRVRNGDRIFGIAREHGAYAEFSEIREGQHDSPFTKIPAGVSDAQAAALPTPGLTALASLEAMDAGTGTELLIVGAAGAVGSIAVQLARERDVQMVAVVKKGQEADTRALGVKTVVTVDGDDLLAAIREVHAEPFDAVLDLVSDAAALKRNAPLIKPGGTLVTTIHDADEAWFGKRDVRAININMAATPQSSPEGLDELARLLEDGRLVITIASERPLEEANAVLDGIKSGSIHGKVILRP